MHSDLGLRQLIYQEIREVWIGSTGRCIGTRVLEMLGGEREKLTFWMIINEEKTYK